MRYIINGFDTDPDSDFDPDGCLSRQQLAALLMSQLSKKRQTVTRGGANRWNKRRLKTLSLAVIASWT